MGGLLCDALAKFRQEFSPRIVTNGLLFNYATLQEAFKVLGVEFNLLFEASNNNYDKCDLVWRQLIGRMVDLLPACERQAFATRYIIENHATLVRSFKLKVSAGNFPVATNDESRSGAGWDFSCDVFGEARGAGAWGAGRPDARACWDAYLEKKQQNLQNIYSHSHEQKRRMY